MKKNKGLVMIIALLMVMGNIAISFGIPIGLELTASTGEEVQGNCFESKQAIYLDGAKLSSGSYYVRVESPEGNLLGESTGADYIINEPTPLVQLWSICNFDDTTNPGGVYKVIVSKCSEFPVWYRYSNTFKVESSTDPKYGIKVTKEADDESVQEGDTITYTIRVTNTGDIALPYILVEDSMFGILDSDLELEAEEYKDYILTKAAVEGTMVNNVTVSALETEVYDTAQAVVNVTKIPQDPTYGIKVTKEADDESVQEGDTITYTIRVTNTGDIALPYILVEDSMFGILDSDLELEAEEYKDYILTKAAVEGTMVNNVTVSALETEVYDTAQAVVNVTKIPQDPTCGIKVTKEADDKSVHVGDIITYTVIVSNISSETLYDIEVDDSMFGRLDSRLVLESEEYKEYIRTASAIQGTMLNTVTASALEGTIIDTAQAIVKVDRESKNTTSTSSSKKTSYKMEITKEVEPKSVNVGDAITYTIVITNTGSGSLKDIQVKDEMLGLDETIERLDKGESKTFSATITAQEEGTLINTVSAENNKAGTVRDRAGVIIKASSRDIPEKSKSDTTTDTITDTTDMKLEIPKTGVGSLMGACGIGLVISGIGTIILKKKE